MDELDPDQFKDGFDVGVFVSNIQNYFLREGNTTPRKVLSLIELLQKLNAMAGNSLLSKVAGGSAERDEAFRLWKVSNGYKVVLDIMHERTKAAIGGVDFELWTNEVVGPLLLGWYPDREQQTVLFAAEVVSLFNQNAALTETAQAAWRAFLFDVSLGVAGELPDTVQPTWPAWAWVLFGLGTLGAVGAAVWGLSKVRGRAPLAQSPGRELDNV